MSQRIFNICTKKFARRIRTREDAFQLQQQVTTEEGNLLSEMVREANLEITNSEAAKSFCKEKIISYLDSYASSLVE